MLPGGVFCMEKDKRRPLFTLSRRKCLMTRRKNEQ